MYNSVAPLLLRLLLLLAVVVYGCHGCGVHKKEEQRGTRDPIVTIIMRGKRIRVLKIMVIVVVLFSLYSLLASLLFTVM